MNPNVTELAALSRAELAVLGREALMAGHLQDRVGIPLVLAAHGQQLMTDVAIDEWMAASPVYAKRTQRLLRFEGDTVDVIAKNIQFDVGAPHQFLDFVFRVDGPHDAEFWLAHCGALADVAPMGESFVHGMCHTIEDPTFDATAVASNPRAQVRPVHRPPGVPAGGPDCRWTVKIRPEYPAAVEHPLTAEVRASRLASHAIDAPPSAEPGGFDDYHHELDPGCCLEDFSHRTLVLLAQEASVQGHMLARGYMLAVAKRFGADEARANAAQMWQGVNHVVAQRLKTALAIGDGDRLDDRRGLGDGGNDTLVRAMRLHPAMLIGDYLGIEIERAGDDGPEHVAARLTLRECDALAEGDGFTLPSLLADGHTEVVETIATGFDERARLRRAPAPPGTVAAYDVILDPGAEPAEVPASVHLCRVSTGATFEFKRRRVVRA